MAITPTDYLRLLLDPVRVAVIGHAAAGALEVAQLATDLEVNERRVLEAVATFRAAGLIDDDLRLVGDTLIELARSMPRGEVVAPSVVEGPWTEEERTVLGRFFVGSRLREIPSNAAKRTIVLERIVQEFEPGVRYEERDVDQLLVVFHPDYASLRRHLVDLGMLTRAEGVYWRTGGRYDV
jgi:hypothetical protein